MKTMLIDVNKNKVQVLDIVDSLDVFYAKLDCRCIDIVTRKIGGVEFDIMCDDEGLFKSYPIPSACDDLGGIMFVGNIMLFHNDGKGNLTGLTDRDIEMLRSHIGLYFDEEICRKVLIGCNY